MLPVILIQISSWSQERSRLPMLQSGRLYKMDGQALLLRLLLLVSTGKWFSRLGKIWHRMLGAVRHWTAHGRFGLLPGKDNEGPHPDSLSWTGWNDILGNAEGMVGLGILLLT